jgi:D-sedoheptulose 7-phosphate isomerase
MPRPLPPNRDPGSTLARVEATTAAAIALVDWLRENEQRNHTIERFSDRLAECLRRGGRILSCGNGGSMCDAMHFAEELSARYRHDRRAFAAQALSDPAHLTCVANDWGFERVFARGVEAWGQPGDALVVFTTSGNSANVIAATEAARARKIDVLGFLGGDGGSVKALCDAYAIVPAKTADRVQEVHIKMVHLVIEEIERRLVPENYAPSPQTPTRARRAAASGRPRALPRRLRQR